MALTICPECSKDVSSIATTCPGYGFRIRKPRRGQFGVIVEWGFVLFNIVMALWLFSCWRAIGEMSQDAISTAEEAGTAIGATIGSGMLLTIWVFGDIILGMFVLFTRPK